MKYFSRRRTGYFGAAMVAMGLLLWARFLLITGHPKTAMATPEAPSGTATSPTTSEINPPSKAKPAQPINRKAIGQSDEPSTPVASH